jgi:hypothetical protein
MNAAKLKNGPVYLAGAKPIGRRLQIMPGAPHEQGYLLWVIRVIDQFRLCPGWRQWRHGH